MVSGDVTTIKDYWLMLLSCGDVDTTFIVWLMLLPTSVHARRRPEQEFVRRTATMSRGGYPDESDNDSHDNRRSHDE